MLHLGKRRHNAASLPNIWEHGAEPFPGPGNANLDFSVAKRWQFSERVSLQLRGEFFNILNHPNFDDLPSEQTFPIRWLGLTTLE